MNVKDIVSNVISNYDGHSAKLLNLLKPFEVFFTCPNSLRECIAFRKCYSCSVHFTLPSQKKASKRLDNAWPIMIGSQLDYAFRKLALERVYGLHNMPNLLSDFSRRSEIATPGDSEIATGPPGSEIATGSEFPTTPRSSEMATEILNSFGSSPRSFSGPEIATDTSPRSSSEIATRSDSPSSEIATDAPPSDSPPLRSPFEVAREPADIALTVFVVNGVAKQMPFFVTNDVTNVHVVRKNVVRVYRYDDEDKGMELNLYMENEDGHKQGETMLRLSTGEEIKNPEGLDRFFFDGPCPTTESTKTLLQHLFRNGCDIDHLGNKVVFSPGHVFYRLFHKTLYNLIREENWKEICKRHVSVVRRSIENGDFSHVISKKTLFHKETTLGGKRTTEQLREIGADNRVYVEKKTTCYRDVNFRCYQMIPYASQTAFFQVSAKVKTNHIFCFNDSHVGFLCVCGTSEARNVGRQMTLARDVRITHEDGGIRPVYDFLRPVVRTSSPYYLVINSACFPVSENYYRRFDGEKLKRRFGTVECYRRDPFVFVNYKCGMIFKRLEDRGLWVSPKDRPYWERTPPSFPFVTSYVADLIPRFAHNAFPKNVLTLNALKNSIVALSPEYGAYFRETDYECCVESGEDGLYRTVLEATDEFSQPWEIRLPAPRVMFVSHRGLTQEDCIVLREDVRAFETRKYHTLKVYCRCDRERRFYFRAAEGESAHPRRLFLGTLVCLDPAFEIVASQSVQTEKKSTSATDLFFAKPEFRATGHELLTSAGKRWNETFLYVTVENEHPCSDGDKLCSLAGQKGVVARSRSVPLAFDLETGRVVVPDLLVNPVSIVGRQTAGQILEVRDKGGRDCYVPRAKGGGALALIGPAFYFSVKYHSCDHAYVGIECTRDKITGQPVRGRSRAGGMRAGTQEITNGFRGNGLAACYEEKILENSDAFVCEEEGVVVPRSVFVCEEDSKMFKVTMETETEPLLTEAL